MASALTPCFANWCANNVALGRTQLISTSADLYHMLDDFYEKYAVIVTADERLDENEFELAVADDAMLKWTAE